MDAYTITGEVKINKAREIMLLSGLRMEIRGMRLTAKGSTCYALIKREYGLKGNKASVFAQFEKYLEGAK